MPPAQPLLPAPIAAAFRKAIGGTTHEIIPITNTPLFLKTVIPSSNTISNADEMSRFAEIWRRGGELDGVRVMSPETLHGATRQCRRLRPDVATGLLPARWGTGFQLGTKRFGPFGRECTGGVRPSRAGQLRDLGRSRPPAGRRCGEQRQARPGPRGQALHRADGPHRRRDTPSFVTCAIVEWWSRSTRIRTTRAIRRQSHRGGTPSLTSRSPRSCPCSPWLSALATVGFSFFFVMATDSCGAHCDAEALNAGLLRDMGRSRGRDPGRSVGIIVAAVRGG